MDLGLRTTYRAATWQGHQETGKGHGHVVCSHTGRSRKEFRYSGAARSDWSSAWPLLLYVIMLVQRHDDTFSDYRTCFAFLAIPGAITILLLWITYKKFPHPENFEPEPKQFIPFKKSRRFVLYIIGISLFAFGFADYSLIVMHFSRTHLFTADVVPLLYALAMLTDAASAFVFGWMFDRHGTASLVISTLVAAPFAIFVFLGSSVAMAVVGVVLWGIGMGAQESILKAAVTTMVPKQSRAGVWHLRVLLRHRLVLGELAPRRAL